MVFLRFLLVLSAIGLFASPASAAIVIFNFAMSGPAENPSNNSPGIGNGTVTFDDVARTMRVQVSFSGLTGNTTQAHIHSSPTNAPGSGNTGVASQTPSFNGFPLGVTAGTMDTTFDMTLAGSFNAAYLNSAANGGSTTTAFNNLLLESTQGRSYFNIHSSTFGGGEIRGFLAVPEPSGLLLTSGLLSALALARRRRVA